MKTFTIQPSAKAKKLARLLARIGARPDQNVVITKHALALQFDANVRTHQRRDGSDDSLLITCKINYYQKSIPVVGYWLPRVRVVRRLTLHRALLQSPTQARVHWEERM